METIERGLSGSLLEVWEWKEAVYREIKDKTLDERMAYFREGLEQAAAALNARIIEHPDGSYSLSA